MNAIFPLVLMWLANQSGAAPSSKPKAKAKKRRPKVKKTKAPKWPTPKSPPPIPAFQPASPPAVPASADPSGPATPLAELHNAPPKLSPASIMEPAKQKAIAAAKKKGLSFLRQGFSANLFGRKSSSAPTSTVLVSQVQQILNRRGANLVPDGLYGPRTAAAWGNAARARNLPTTIVREGPKIAKVATQTFEALSAAPIP